MSWLLFPSSGNHVTLEPEWDFVRNDTMIKNEHYTRAGKRFVYKWGSRIQFKFDVEFVNSSTMAIVNSWWGTNTKLLLMESGTTSVYSVMLTNRELPIGKYIQPYTTIFKGTIELDGY